MMTQKKRATTKKKMSKGQVYGCEVCGLVVTVNEDCGCAEVCDIICCGEPMQERKSRVKTAK